MANHDPRPTLKKILEYIENSRIQESLDSISSKLNLVAKNSQSEQQTKFKRISSYLVKLLAPGTIISLAIFLINSNNARDNAPLNYSLDLICDVPKYLPHPDEDSDVFFTLSPYANFKFQRNDGGLLKDLFLITFSSDQQIKVHAPIIENSNNSMKPHPDMHIDTDSGASVVWYTKDNSLAIFFSDSFLDMDHDKASSSFLVTKGQNQTYSIITLLFKIGTKNENYQDHSLTFTDIEIFDKLVWERKTTEENMPSFLNEYDTTIENYQKVIEWLKSVTL